MDAIYAEFVKSLCSKLASYAENQVQQAWGVSKEVKKLQRTMNTINAVLEDYSNGGNSNMSRVDQDWFHNLQDVVYELDNIFDEIVTKAEKKKLMQGNAFGKKVKLFFSSSNQIYSSFELAQRIKSIREVVDDILGDQSICGRDADALRPLVRERAVELTDGGDEDVFVPDNIVGREKDKETVVSMVLRSDLGFDNQENVAVIPIVGIGGLGKTTLARQVYDDERVKECFELRLWVSVPREIRVKEMMERVVSTATGEDVGKWSLEQLRIRFSELVNGKKYVLILDNIWNENPLIWRDLRPILTLGAAPGSKILVTTRSLMVGEIMSTVPSYQLQPLNDEESRALFERIVFETKDRHESGTRELVGEILRMCRNVPLVIRALAGVLATKFTKREWLLFKDEELSKLAAYGADFDVMRILRLSYDYLQSSKLKSCFAYLCLFPRGQVMNKSNLVSLWIAQGFVNPTHRKESLEEAGEANLQTLIKRSLIQDVQEGASGTCKLHDLMYDLSSSVQGGQGKKMTSLEDVDYGRRMLHMSINYKVHANWEIPTAWQSIRQLRTFILAQRPNYEIAMQRSVCDDLIRSFPCLRVLDLHGLGLVELPESIGKLIHLRYLKLSENNFQELPNSITLLHNLESLELHDCWSLVGIPKDMKKLVNLRHLLIHFWSSWDKLCYFPSGFENLTNLQRLGVFVVPDSQNKRVKSMSGGKKSNCARLGDLKSLNSLRETLAIVIAGSYQNMALDAIEANLKGKKDLKSLTLHWQRDYYEEDELVLQNLQPHYQIPGLSIYEYHGEKLPTWMATNQLASYLSQLSSITIHTCERITQVPSFALLPNLKSIVYYNLFQVEYLESDIDKYGKTCSSSSPITFFPSLTYLEIGHMHKLRGWGRSRSGELSLPIASDVSVYHCYELQYMPTCPNVQHLIALYVPENLQMLKECNSSSASAAALSSSAVVASPPPPPPDAVAGPKLEDLEISSVEHLVTLPKAYLKKVTKLSFGWGARPMNFPLLGDALRLMNSLHALQFFECRSLTTLSGLPEQLSTLERLEFDRCNWAADFSLIRGSNSYSSINPWSVLQCLRFLKIGRMENMEVLPWGIQSITTLQTLELSSCPKLSAIPDWIGNLSSLTRLSINKCPDIPSMPQQIQQLQNLQQLVVDLCPRLADRCQRDIGQDWHLIQHIPDVIILR